MIPPFLAFSIYTLYIIVIITIFPFLVLTLRVAGSKLLDFDMLGHTNSNPLYVNKQCFSQWKISFWLQGATTILTMKTVLNIPEH